MRNHEAKPGSRNFRVIKGGYNREQKSYEEKIEARLEAVGEAVEHFVTSLPAALLAEESSSREIIDDLVVKQFALRWMVRAAKHSQGAIRQTLWSDIDQSLAGLEKTLELLPHLAFPHGYSRVPVEDRRFAASSHLS